MPPRKVVKFSSRNRETQRDIAVRRAEHFAVTNSTPSGVIGDTVPPDGGGRVSGPFTIANEILSQAAANRQLREEAYALEDQDELDAITGKDVYEEKLKEVIRESRNAWQDDGGNDKGSKKMGEKASTPQVFRRERMTGPIDTLQDLCVKKLVSVFDLVDNLEGMHPETLARLATALGKARKFDHRAALLVAAPGTDSIYLPECSALEEETILKAIGQVTVPLRSLQLRNCGHSLNDKTAIALAEHVSSLEILELGGCYKLADAALEALLRKCKSLEELNLSCDTRLGTKGLEAIVGIHSLRSLSLRDCSHLTDKDLLLLLGGAPTSSSSSSSSSSGGGGRSQLASLEDLSLAGLSGITAESVIPLIKAFGPNLRGLNVGGCVLLGDDVLVQTRQSCSRLERLNLEELGRATAAGLLGLFLNTSQEESTEESEQTDEPVGKRRKIVHLSGNGGLRGGIGPLESVSLRNVRNATDETLQYLTESCKGLRHINIGGCSNLTSKSAICLALNAKELQTLDVSFVRGLQNEAMIFLVNSCRGLHSLTVWGCTQLSSFFDAHANGELLVVGRQ